MIRKETVTMPCDTRLKPRQTISQRKDEIRRVVASLSSALATGRVKIKIGPQGAVAFQGLSEAERDGVTDACMFRRLMVEGTVTAKAALMRAEQLAGRSVNKQQVAIGAHSHDGGHTWHDHKG